MNYFYQPEIFEKSYLEGEEARHCLKVLRHKEGDRIGILDGKGHMYLAQISEVRKDQCQLIILETKGIPKKPFYCHLVIAPVKSADRIEWLVEKAGEIGVDEISFLHTEHSERARINFDRLSKKAVGALKQAKTGYLMKLNPILSLKELLRSEELPAFRYIAVVEENLPYFFDALTAGGECMILIGPEGDFSPEEVAEAETLGFKKVSLGQSVLRTETAGLLACHAVNLVNGY